MKAPAWPWTLLPASLPDPSPDARLLTGEPLDLLRCRQPGFENILSIWRLTLMAPRLAPRRASGPPHSRAARTYRLFGLHPQSKLTEAQARAINVVPRTGQYLVAPKTPRQSAANLKAPLASRCVTYAGGTQSPPWRSQPRKFAPPGWRKTTGKSCPSFTWRQKCPEAGASGEAARRIHRWKKCPPWSLTLHKFWPPGQQNEHGEILVVADVAESGGGIIFWAQEASCSLFSVAESATPKPGSGCPPLLG